MGRVESRWATEVPDPGLNAHCCHPSPYPLACEGRGFDTAIVRSTANGLTSPLAESLHGRYGYRHSRRPRA